MSILLLECDELKSIRANGAIPYSADLDDFAFELEVVEMDENAQFSFGVQDRSCDVDIHIGLGKHLWVENHLMENMKENHF